MLRHFILPKQIPVLMLICETYFITLTVEIVFALSNWRYTHIDRFDERRRW